MENKNRKKNSALFMFGGVPSFFMTNFNKWVKNRSLQRKKIIFINYIKQDPKGP